MAHNTTSPGPGISVLFISIAMILYPSTVLLVPKMNGLIYGLFVLVSLFFVVRQREISLKFTDDEKSFYISIIVFFLVVFLITLSSGFVYKTLGKYLHLLLAIPVYIYLRHFGVKLAFVWFGLVAGSIVSACVAAYDIWGLEMPRARGLTHPIVFGDLALLMGFMSVAGLGWFKQRASWQIIFPVIAMVSGLFASILSYSRGGWIAVPFLLVVFFWYIKSSFSFKQKAALVISILIFFGAIYAIPQTGVSYQIDRTINSLQVYSDSDISSENRATSVGARLEMWQASWKIFVENPIFGVGWGHYQVQAELQVKQGLRNRSAALFDHPHSQYLTALASGGLIGLAVTLMLLLTPAWLFVKYIKQKKTEDISRIALAGLLLVVAFMVFGISEPLLDRARSVNFFAFYLVIFMAAIHGQLRLGVDESSGNRV